MRTHASVILPGKWLASAVGEREEVVQRASEIVREAYPGFRGDPIVESIALPQSWGGDGFRVTWEWDDEED
jgi:hypothetical protein